MLPVHTSNTVKATSRPGWITGTLRRSVRPGAAHDGPDRLPEDHEVEGQRPVLDVADVDAHGIVPGEVRPAAHLPEAGEPRLDQEPAVHVEPVPLHLGGQRRAWPDER